jgi:serine/threonine protein kinase
MSHLTPALSNSSRRVLLLALLTVWFGFAPYSAGVAIAQDNQPAKDAASEAPTIKRTKQAQGSKTTWVTYALWGGGGAVGLIILVVLVMKVQSSSKRKSGPGGFSDVIGGYKLLNSMMTGQTSQVWEVVEVASGRHFAMKMLLPEKISDAEHQRLLLHEAQVGIKMAHPNVIKIVKFDKNPHNPYFVMEFFPAGNLKLRVMHKKWDFIKEKALDIFKQSATALAYMNASGWVHRDVKPDNILVNSAGEVRLIDFALTQRISRGGLFRRGTRRTAGTRSYMSPEQIRGHALDGRADIYSFGCSCYEVVTGRQPFRAATPQELLNKHFTEKPVSPQVYNPDVTDKFAALVLRMMAKKKEDRPKDFHEVLMELRNIQVFKTPAPQKSQSGAEPA